MKIVSKDGYTWVEKKQDKMIVGFTQALLNELGECWSILPAVSSKVEVKEDQPLCSVETNDGVFCVKSPVKGMITFFENKAINFPDKLTEETHVVTLKEKAAQEDEFVEAEAQQAARPRFGNLEAARNFEAIFDLPQNIRVRANLDPEQGPVRLADLNEAVRAGNMTMAQATRRWQEAERLGRGVR